MFTADEQGSILNKDLVDTALNHLLEAGLEASVKPASGSQRDASVDVVIKSPSGEHTYAAQVKSAVTPQSAAALRGSADPPLLVITPYVSDAVAELWRGRDIDYVDAAGNMLLRWGTTLIDVRGRRRKVPVSGRRAPRMFQPKGIQVLFVLLWQPELISAPMRAIAGKSSTSLGGVKGVIDDLVDAGFAYGGRSQRRLVRQRELFDRWVEAYALVLAPRIGIGTFRAPEPRWWRSAEQTLRRENVQLGGESAAYLIDGHLQTTHAVLYAESTPDRLALKYRWQNTADAANVEIRRRFWKHDPEDGLLVPTPLIYADLSASGDDRQREAGARLRERDEILRRIDDR